MTEIKQLTGTAVIDVALDTLEKKKQALIFVNSKRSAEKTAEDIAKRIKKDNKGFYDEDLDKLAEKILGVLSKPTKQCKRVSESLKYGIAFHHAGLHNKQKELIEDAFRKGIVKMISCTPTLAYGLDLPAFRAIIRDVRRFGPRGLQFIPVLEYLQICGRAGRPKYDKVGEAIVLCQTEAMKEEVTERYLKGEPENIYSKLAVEPVLRTYLLSLISSGFARTRQQIMEFFSKTFWAYQYKDMQELELKIEKMLLQLIEWEFIQELGESGGDFVSATEFGGDKKYRATFLGKRIAELYLDPLTGYNFVTAIKRTDNVKNRKDFTYLHLVCNTLEMRPLLRVKNKEYDEMNDIEVMYEPYLLQSEPSLYDYEYDDFMNAIKTAYMLHEWIEEKDDEFLLEKFAVRPGEVRVKINLADWMLYCMIEIAQILQNIEVIKEIKKTRMRLKYGVKEELLPLLKLDGVGRVRARKLFSNKIKDVKDVKKADLAALMQLLGKKLAVNVKKQVGEPVKEEISPKKRKGQMSLGKFDKDLKQKK